MIICFSSFPAIIIIIFFRLTRYSHVQRIQPVSTSNYSLSQLSILISLNEEVAFDHIFGLKKI